MSILDSIKKLEKQIKPASFLLTYNNIRVLQVFKVADMIRWDGVFSKRFSSGLALAVALNKEIPDHEKIMDRFENSDFYSRFTRISFDGQVSYYMEFTSPVNYNALLENIDKVVYEIYYLPKETVLNWKLWVAY